MRNVRYNAFVIVKPGFSENEGGIENDILSIASNKLARQIGKADALGLSRILDNRLFIYPEPLKNSGNDLQLTYQKYIISTNEEAKQLNLVQSPVQQKCFNKSRKSVPKIN